MDSRQLAPLLSTLVSQLTLLILLLFPNNHSFSHPPHSHTLFSLLHHLLSSTHTLSLTLQTRKRTRTHLPESHPDPDPLLRFPRLGQLGRLARVDSVNSFRVMFRMDPSTFEWLSGLLEPLLECRDPAGLELGGLSAELRLGIGLFRLATGASYEELAARFRVSDRVAKFCTKQLCRVLCTNFRFWVGFPNSAEVSENFEGLSGLPNCGGAIVCTRFTIRRDNVSNEEESVAVQIVVDSSCRILSIIAGFSGKKSNYEILKSSSLFEDIEGGKLLNAHEIRVGKVGAPQYLVGDKGYPLLPWLITPFHSPQPGSNEDKFNDVHGLMRISTRKTVASLRNWGILSKPIEEDFRNRVAYIGACAILHNAMLLREDYSGLCNTVEDYMVYDDHSLQHSYDHNVEENSVDGCIIRNALATRAKDITKDELNAMDIN